MQVKAKPPQLTAAPHAAAPSPLRSGEKIEARPNLPLVMAVLDTAILEKPEHFNPCCMAGPEPSHDERERFDFFTRSKAGPMPNYCGGDVFCWDGFPPSRIEATIAIPEMPLALSGMAKSASASNERLARCVFALVDRIPGRLNRRTQVKSQPASANTTRPREPVHPARSNGQIRQQS